MITFAWQCQATLVAYRRNTAWPKVFCASELQQLPKLYNVTLIKHNYSGLRESLQFLTLFLIKVHDAIERKIFKLIDWILEFIPHSSDDLDISLILPELHCSHLF